jgi:hypothetical protein
MLPLAAIFTLLLEYVQLTPLHEIFPADPDETLDEDIVVLVSCIFPLYEI